MTPAWPLLALLCLTAPSRAHGFPPSIEAMRPALAQAERRLQDATLAHEAARREAGPYNEAAVQARARADHWWGRWRLRRALGRLKERLDRVEAARVEQEAARQELFLLLTAMEEELRGALERALAADGRQRGLRGWWQQEQAWSRRLEALESGLDDPSRPDPARRPALLAQARLEQLERDLGLLRTLAGRGLLDPAAARADEVRLRESLRRWRRWAAAPEP